MPRARALVLDRTHHVLAFDGALPRAEASAGERPLAALVRALERRLSVALSPPIGARPLVGAPFEFVFLTERPPTPIEGATWIPLRALATRLAGEADAAWRLYTDVVLGGWEPPRRELDVFAFGAGAEAAARLGHMVVKGQKRATAGWIAAEEKKGATVPWPGLVSIVTDGFGVPLCAIRTERVERVPFRAATEEAARAEAEGDRSFDDWREGHRAWFRREAEELDLAWSDEAEIFVEHFKVLKILGRAS